MATQASITPQELEFQLAHWNDDNGSLVIMVTTIFTVCAIIAVLLRLVTRRAVIEIAWQLDDYAIIIALVLSVRNKLSTIQLIHSLGLSTRTLR